MRPAVLAALGVAAVLAGGCGFGAGRDVGGATITVTQDFGSRPLGQASAPHVPGGETVMRLLERRFPVGTRYGGAFVQRIGKLSAGRAGGRSLDWFYYVNGIQAGKGAASTTVHAGDRIWWDRHDWGATLSIPAVVGSFPEPFRSGSGGQRRPVRIDCAPGADAACTEVGHRLDAAGVPAARAAIGATTGTQTLRLVVGTWRTIRGDAVARQLERGPRQSGVYARPAASGATIAVLDARGAVARTLGAGAGLVAATRVEDEQPTWVVTGTDTRGLAAAARALDEGDLGGHFALAISSAGLGVPAPVVR